MMEGQTQKQQMTSRWGQLKSERASWFAHWQEITQFFLPRNGRYFLQDRDRGYRRHNSIYDNTGSRALRVLAAGLMGGLTSPARPWFRLGVADEELMKDPDVKRWLANVTQLMLNVFQQSNTYRALHTGYSELGAFGTSATIVDSDFDSVIHSTPVTIGEYCIATNWKGIVGTLYREFQKTIGEVVKEFGYGNCCPATQRMYDTHQLDKWITILHVIEPRADRNPNMKDAKNMLWKSVYYEVGGEPNQPLRESGYKIFPGLVPRWEVAGGDIYGNSPGMEALGDQKQLQHENLRKGQAIDYQTRPPLQAPPSMKNREVEGLPGGLTYVDSANPNGGIKTMWEVNLNLGDLKEDIQDVRDRIRSSFFADIFLMLSQLSNQTGKMTATEVAELHEEKMLMLGPVLERLQNELLDPLIELTFQKMMEVGMIPPPPPQMRGQTMQVELISVLAQAQRAVATNGIDRFVGNLGQIAAVKADVLDKFDADKWADIYSDMLGVDPELIVPDKVVAVIRSQRQQQQMQAAQQEAAQQASQTAKNLGTTPTQGGASNALQDVTKMYSGYT